jgi:hypothetical protein
MIDASDLNVDWSIVKEQVLRFQDCPCTSAVVVLIKR